MSAPFPLDAEPLPASVHVTPWLDPLVDRRGHDPRSAYVEQFWLSVLGPTATWLLRRLVAGFDHHPDGYELDVPGTARSLGLSVTKGTASPFAKALQRCAMFGVVQQLSETWVVRRRMPPVSQRHLLRLPTDLQHAHEQWTTMTIRLDALARAHALAAAMLAAGDDRGVLEPQLIAVGVPPPAAAEACELLRRQAS
ncbi:MAG: hypothetical protein ABW122_10770 [Ilumatobacteraceae bacterium]